jgi:hypothetical protein
MATPDLIAVQHRSIKLSIKCAARLWLQRGTLSRLQRRGSACESDYFFFNKMKIASLRGEQARPLQREAAHMILDDYFFFSKMNFCLIAQRTAAPIAARNDTRQNEKSLFSF